MSSPSSESEEAKRTGGRVPGSRDAAAHGPTRLSEVRRWRLLAGALAGGPIGTLLAAWIIGANWGAALLAILSITILACAVAAWRWDPVCRVLLHLGWQFAPMLVVLAIGVCFLLGIELSMWTILPMLAVYAALAILAEHKIAAR